MNKKPLTVLLLITLLLTMFSSFSAIAYADELDAAAQEITEGITSGLDKAYSILKAVSLPVAVICLVIAGYKIFGIATTKSIDEGKNTIVHIAIAMAIIYLGPIIVKAISGWFGEYDITGTK